MPGQDLETLPVRRRHRGWNGKVINEYRSISVTRPVAVTMRIAALVLLGAVCFTRLPVDLLPNVSLPTVAINTNWPNVAPEEIETQVTRPLERAVSSVPGSLRSTSNSNEGSSSVRVQFNGA
jgi:HAE1 family hydrophobic/amphiphilic exporter-1